MGFAYQLGFVQVFQRFPVQQPARAAKSRAAPDFPFDPDLLPHVSPIEWNNVILYGEIKIDPAKLKLRVPWRLFLHESGRHPTLQQWGGPDAAFKRMNELKRQLSPKEAVPQGSRPQGSGYRYRYTPDRQPLHLAFHSAHRHRF